MSICPVAAIAVSEHLQCKAARDASGPPANDNTNTEIFDHVLTAALRHFARHGLNCVPEARKRAEEAFVEGDSQAYLWWLGICRVLDQRMAREISRVSHGLG